MFATIENNVHRKELEKFYKENLKWFLNIAYLMLHNESDAEDAVQEAFNEIADKPDNFFGIAPNNRAAYMAVVVRNISSDMLSKKNKAPLEALDENIPYDELSFEDSIIGEFSKDKIKQFIKSLPPLQRDVLILRRLMGFSVAETADKLNISQSAVKKRLHLAKEAVREYLRNR